MSDQVVIAAKTAPRCKLCALGDQRPAVDELLRKRSAGEPDENGRRVNGEYVLEHLRAIGVDNPTLDNIKTHWKNHVTVVERDTAEAHAAVTAEARELLRSRLEAGVDVDGVLDTIIATGMASLEVKALEDVLKSGVTVDHVLKAVAEKTKRRSNDAANAILGNLTGALAQALTGRKPAELVEGEAEDAEIVGIPEAAGA